MGKKIAPEPTACGCIQHATCPHCGRDSVVSKRGDGEWLCPLCYWSGIPGMGTDPVTELKAAAWDALVTLLPRLGEWERGRVLAADGRLLDWVMREKERGDEGSD